jgi:predicted nucleic acid-binding protein
VLLYLDTSVWSYLLADHLPREQAITRSLIETAPARHELYVPRSFWTNLTPRAKWIAAKDCLRH